MLTPWRMTPLPEPQPLGRLNDWVVAAKPGPVRDALVRIAATQPMTDLSPDLHGTAQIVLAEVLNNIVEHACIGMEGEISVTLWHTAQGLACRVIDDGRAMPDGALPDGRLPDIAELSSDDLPEGGFGWHLIRTLTHSLHYIRVGDRNQLDFVIRDTIAD
jgi:serine/threonine-protein kinase RsbW